MSESAIRAQVYAIVTGVTNIGKVYDYERWAPDWATFISLFKTTIATVDQIRGWEVGRKSAGEKDFAQGGHTEKSHVFLIRGYLGLKDASATEKTFNDLIEAISAAFRTNKTLNGSAWNHNYIQVEIIEPRMFGDVLCHYTELSLEVLEL